MFLSFLCNSTNIPDHKFWLKIEIIVFIVYHLLFDHACLGKKVTSHMLLSMFMMPANSTLLKEYSGIFSSLV